LYTASKSYLLAPPLKEQGCEGLLYERNFKERKYSILIDRRSRNEEALKKKMKKQQQQQQQEGTKDMKEQKPTIQRLDTSKKNNFTKSCCRFRNSSIEEGAI